jgi:hypothetical protein
MSVVKVIEILAQSENSWEEAAANAVSEASKSVKNIQSAYCHDFQVKVEDGKVVAYRVAAKISFLVEK